ncbi:helix-turn-helix domain-containing protein [Vallitalea guaymasensis]|uniref:helix-turn-helix domain-containing protein n=1 Tax=Vallitalea guaymasensis TaxID=1185412 RepID=UPI000DE32CE9|nr:helix-turn-helix transcriptional regulator [Vallitalea guaymasensis]
MDIHIELKIREARKIRYMTMSELARRAGISKATLSDIENGVKHPKLKTYCKICSALEIPIDNEILECVIRK